jgi:hypothetical protein
MDPDQVIRNNRVNLDEETKDRMVFRKFPLGCWAIVFLGLVGFFYMMYHFTLGHEYGVLFGNQHSEDFPIWTYVLVVAFGLIVIAFLIIGKIDTIVIDKRLKYLSKSRVSLCCIRQKSERDTSDMTGINAYKRGH